MSYKKRKIKILESAQGYDKYAKAYDKDHEFLDSFEQGYFQWLNRDLIGKKVLEIGCGTGRNTLRLAQTADDLTVVDISEEMLNAVKIKIPKVTTILADAYNLPFPEDNFDLIFCHMVLVHLKNPEIALNEFYRVCRDNGEMYLTILHQRDPALLKANGEEFKIKSYYHSADKIRNILEEQSWQIKEERPIIEKDRRISTIFWCQK